MLLGRPLLSNFAISRHEREGSIRAFHGVSRKTPFVALQQRYHARKRYLHTALPIREDSRATSPAPKWHNVFQYAGILVDPINKIILSDKRHSV
jgi:hypothetical protein